MRSIYLFLVLLIVGGSSFRGFGQTNQTNVLEKAFAFVDSIFQEPSFTFEEQEMEFSPAITDIALKFNAAIASNQAWFDKYAKEHFKAGQGLPYHENFGISKEEFELFKKMGKDTQDIQLKTGRVEEIAIRRNNQVIHFTGKDNLAVFNYLQIDLANKRITLGKDTIPFSVEVNATNSPVFGSWHGFNWNFEQANQSAETLQRETLTAKMITLNIGKTVTGNRLLLTLKLQRVENGVNKQLLDILGFIR